MLTRQRIRRLANNRIRDSLPSSSEGSELDGNEIQVVAEIHNERNSPEVMAEGLAPLPKRCDGSGQENQLPVPGATRGAWGRARGGTVTRGRPRGRSSTQHQVMPEYRNSESVDGTAGRRRTHGGDIRRGNLMALDAEIDLAPPTDETEFETRSVYEGGRKTRRTEGTTVDYPEPIKRSRNVGDDLNSLPTTVEKLTRIDSSARSAD